MGIYVGGTDSAHHLNDYEEGNWTPRWHGQGNNVTISTNTNNGTYTKVGDLINVKCYSAWSARNGANGILAVDGLPFSNSGNYTTVNLGYWANMSNLNQVFGNLVGFMADGSQEVQFYAITSTGLENSDVNKTTNSTSIMLNFSYRIWTS